LFGAFENLIFEFVSDFDIRISNFSPYFVELAKKEAMVVCAEEESIKMNKKCKTNPISKKVKWL